MQFTAAPKLVFNILGFPEPVQHHESISEREYIAEEEKQEVPDIIENIHVHFHKEGKVHVKSYEIEILEPQVETARALMRFFMYPRSIFNMSVTQKEITSPKDIKSSKFQIFF